MTKTTVQTSCLIKSQEDLDKHFKWHKEEQEKFSNAKQQILDSIKGDVMTKEELEAYEYLDKLYENLYADCYPLELESGKITMYVNHEGSCMSNIQYCPFCGIKFEVEIE